MKTAAKPHSVLRANVAHRHKRAKDLIDGQNKHAYASNSSAIRSIDLRAKRTETESHNHNAAPPPAITVWPPTARLNNAVKGRKGMSVVKPDLIDRSEGPRIPVGKLPVRPNALSVQVSPNIDPSVRPKLAVKHRQEIKRAHKSDLQTTVSKEHLHGHKRERNPGPNNEHAVIAVKFAAIRGTGECSDEG